MIKKDLLEDSIYEALMAYLLFHQIASKLDNMPSGERNLEINNGLNPLTLGVMVEVHDTLDGHNEAFHLEEIVETITSWNESRPTEEQAAEPITKLLVIIDHNYHAFDQPSNEQIVGPFSDRESAIRHLRVMQEKADDELFKLDETAGFLGYEYDELEQAERDGGLCSEIWAQIVELTPA